MDYAKERERLTQKSAGMIKEREKSWLPKWKEIRDYIAPDDGQFPGDEQNDGKRKDSLIINPKARLALAVCQAGMSSGMTSQARPWFELAVPEGVPSTTDVRRWIYAVQIAIRNALAKSNLYNILPLVYASEATYGTAAMAALPDEQDIVRFYHYPVGTFCLATSDKGVVDTFYREFKMQARQMVQQFGEANVSKTVKEAAERNSQQWFCVSHMVEPNDDLDVRKLDNRSMPWRSTYWEASQDNERLGILRTSGFKRFPIMAPRWSVNGTNIYGTGPGDVGLGKCKELQLLERDKMRMVKISANPSMTAPVSLRGQRATTVPGDITWVRDDIAGVAFRPTYVPDPNSIQQVRVEINECEQDISAVFFEDLFLMISQQDGTMTAYEVAQLKEEKMLMMGPVVERNNDELLDPLIDQVFSILYDRSIPYWMGLKAGEPPIPPPPQELQGTELRVEYISILAQAQKMVAVGSIERALQFTGSIAALDPSAMDKINVDAAQDEYYTALGVPPTILRGDDEVAAMRQARAQAQFQQQQIEQGQMLANSAKTLSETPTGGDTALDALTAAVTQ